MSGLMSCWMSGLMPVLDAELDFRFDAGLDVRFNAGLEYCSPICHVPSRYKNREIAGVSINQSCFEKSLVFREVAGVFKCRVSLNDSSFYLGYYLFKLESLLSHTLISLFLFHSLRENSTSKKHTFSSTNAPFSLNN